MKQGYVPIIPLLVILFMLHGCATVSVHDVSPTPINHAQEEIPEDSLLDVGILVFNPGELSKEDKEKEGTNAEIRKAESHFIPVHLQYTLQRSSHWGAVQVIPTEETSVDVVVKGEIIKSNGEELDLKVAVLDATGKEWFRRIYKADAETWSYEANEMGERDAFQDLYNAVANHMTEYMEGLSDEETLEIREISKLKFAANIAKNPYKAYLKKDKKGRITIKRLPADNDPMLGRVLQIRERDLMYVDVLNEYYETYYARMFPEYEAWRKADLTERKSVRAIKKDAMVRKVAGILLMAAAVGLGMSDVKGTGALQATMAIVGGQVFVDGINISGETKIHAAAIQELSESFGSEMEPITMEFEGKKYELTGSAEEQYERWQELLRKIYEAETGFSLDTPPSPMGSK
jgi:hypothetical protein